MDQKPLNNQDLTHATIPIHGHATQTTAAIELKFTPFVMDTLSDQPICSFVQLPSDAIATQIAERCAGVRRIIEVWGIGETAEQACCDAVSRYDSLIAPAFAKAATASASSTIAATSTSGEAPAFVEPTWRVHFQRYGKGGGSGLDPAGRQKLLKTFEPILINLKGNVDMTNPSITMMYLEDWHSYQAERIALIAKHKEAKRRKHGHSGSSTSSAEAGTDLSQQQKQKHGDGNDHDHEEEHLPQHDLCKESSALQESNYSRKKGDPYAHLVTECAAGKSIFGRIVAEGICVQGHFDLKKRPYLGTTSMNALCAHIAANAAQVRPGQRVLDPFCGTGSLLIAAAHCGADVVGSDIDADCLGLLTDMFQTEENPGGIPIYWRSKNARFKRDRGYDQSQKCTRDNFAFYGLEHRLIGLLGVNAVDWVTKANATAKASDSCDPKPEQEPLSGGVPLTMPADGPAEAEAMAGSAQAMSSISTPQAATSAKPTDIAIAEFRRAQVQFISKYSKVSLFLMFLLHTLKNL